jgi:carbamoyltransferase
MPTILGFHDSPFDSGATLIKDGEILAAIHEERITRIKHCGGFPWRSITEVLDISNVDPSEIDVVAVGSTQPDFIVQLLQGFFKSSSNLNPLKSKIDRNKLYAFEKYESLIYKNFLFGKIDTTSSNILLHQILRILGIKEKIERVDHHLCHAASAFYSSGFEKCLVITADARGDGISTSVNIADKNGIQRVSSSPESASMGHFYGGVTEVLDLGYADGEGKTEALAAFGNYSNAYEKLKSYISVDNLVLKGRMSPYQRLISVPFSKLLKSFKREDIAFAAQKVLEETYLNLIANAIEETGITNIALAGGIFLNVKLNQKIMELPEVKDIFIHPAAGDHGISTGAAFALYSKMYGLKTKRWKHVYLGNEFSNAEIKDALDKFNCKYECIEYIGSYVGEELLPRGYIIGWFQNRMEYGPRALGARSVLIDPRSRESPDKVRSTIKNRPAFQPFCPSMLKESEDKYLLNPKNVDSSFMILAFRAKQRMINETPSVVFIDSSTRVQTVDARYNRRYYEVLTAFGKETGVPIR